MLCVESLNLSSLLLQMNLTTNQPDYGLINQEVFTNAHEAEDP
jgi:hypothetical protein